MISYNYFIYSGVIYDKSAILSESIYIGVVFKELPPILISPTVDAGDYWIFITYTKAGLLLTRSPGYIIS